jgi:hypothetical protein
MAMNPFLTAHFGPAFHPKTSELLAAFYHVPATYRPVMFWYWNADPTEDRLREELRQLRDAGCGGVCILPMPDPFRKRDFIAGMQTPYLSQQFFGYIRSAVDEAARLGLQVWLYDEGGWPSGHALYKVPEGHPDFRGWALKLAGAEAEVVPQGYPADLMNPAAVRRFIELTHEGYRRWVGREFGKTITAVFTDEMRVGGRLGSDTLPWTPDLPRIFRERKGYDLKPLEALFDSGPETARLRYDFCDVWSSLFREAYLEQIRAWCKDHGLLSVGHFPGEDEFQGPARYGFGDVMRGLEALDIPAVDAIWRQIFPGSETDFPRFAGSSARQAGKRHACTESFAVYGWGLTPGQMKWITDHQYVRGINLMTAMMAVYDMRGCGMANTASHLAWGNPMWRFFRAYADYTGRLGWMLSQGEPVVRVAVYVPVRSLWVKPEDGDTERSFHALARELLSRQVDFDYIGDDALDAASSDGGAFRVGSMRYEALALPSCYAMPAATLSKIREFAQARVTVVTVGSAPMAADAPDEKNLPAGAWTLVRRLANEEQAANLIVQGAGGTANLDPACPAVRCCRRRAGDFDIMFFTNESGERLHFAARVQIAGEPFLCDPQTATVGAVVSKREGKNAAFRVHLPPWGSALLVFDRTGAANAALESRAAEGPPRAVHATDLTWRARAIERLAITERGIETVHPEDDPRPMPFGDWRRRDPYFSGRVEYVAELQAQAPGHVIIDFGEVRHGLELWVNDQLAGVRAWSPYCVSIGSYLRPGRNKLRAVVTNTLANEFARPQTKALMRQLGWHNVYRQRAEGFEADELP